MPAGKDKLTSARLVSTDKMFVEISKVFQMCRRCSLVSSLHKITILEQEVWQYVDCKVDGAVVFGTCETSMMKELSYQNI